jgi:hypothetical protein
MTDPKDVETFVKLVRQDYSSFHDPTFKWPVCGVVEVKDADPEGECGRGLHLGVSVEKVLNGGNGVGFPFRVLKVRPLGPILGQNANKIRVARAETLGEIPPPIWVDKIQKRIAAIPEECRNTPWWRGTDSEKAKRLIRSHFELLVPFGFKLDFDIEILTKRKQAEEAAVAWNVAWDAAKNVAWNAAMDAARNAAWNTAMNAARNAAWNTARNAAWNAAMDAAWDAAMDAAWNAAMDAARDAAWNTAMDAAWDVSGIDKPNPFKPLWKCWKLGVWPIGFVGKTFKIYAAPKEKK